MAPIVPGWGECTEDRNAGNQELPINSEEGIVTNLVWAYANMHPAQGKWEVGSGALAMAK